MGAGVLDHSLAICVIAQLLGDVLRSRHGPENI
jgi:hypothetical protein